MKEKNLLIQNYLLLMFVILMVANIKLFADGTQPVGSGTPSSPYEIATLDNLLWISTNSSSWDKYFIQTADIDASATSTWNSNGSGGYYGFSPIGFNDIAFTGSYDGNNHTISRLYIHRPNDDYNSQGFFGLVKGATIKNLGVTAVDITGDGAVGGLIGSASTYHSSFPLTITNCYTSGSVVGGAGGGNYTGGLIGYLRAFSYDVTVTDCFSSCGVSKTSQAGGLIGEARGTSSVTHKISNCYSSGRASGYYDVGGLIGKCNQYCEVDNCYSIADVNGVNDRIGGLVGYNFYSTISNCYSKGSVSGNSSLGGLVGSNDNSTVSNSFWDTQTSGQSSSDGGTGKTTSEMKTETTFTGAGWDFADETTNGNDDYWDINTDRNRGYPYLSWQTFSEGTAPDSGDGSSGNPYQIATLDNLLWISSHLSSWDKCFIQTADIDASATEHWNFWDGFSPIGNVTNQFTGTYDGNNHTISSLHIRRSHKDYQAFFGYASGATIKNIGLTGVDIFGASFSGGLVGMSENSSSVEHSYSTGNISGSDIEIGGLIGTNNATISYCYSTCGVTTSEDYVGGLAGSNAGIINCSYSSGAVTSSGDDIGGLVGISFGPNPEINNCYSTGNVSGNAAVGGLVGESYTPISNCYSTGSVSGSSTVGGLVGENNSSVNNSFWDTQTSGQSSSDGGTGKTTAEMKTKSTFTNAGWDFVGESANGNNDYWDIDGSKNDGYPILYITNLTTPVELISFTAHRIGENIVLNWQTATEVNNYGFEVERYSLTATPVKTWKKIGFIEGHGNSNSPNEYSFVDADKLIGNVQYRLKQLDFNGCFEYSGIAEVEIIEATEFKLSQNYPNPFNPTTVIEFSIPCSGQTTLEVYNVLGQKVKTLVNKELKAGSYSYQFDANSVTSGIYFYKLQSNAYSQIKKMILLK